MSACAKTRKGVGSCLHVRAHVYMPVHKYACLSICIFVHMHACMYYVYACMRSCLRPQEKSHDNTKYKDRKCLIMAMLHQPNQTGSDLQLMKNFNIVHTELHN